MQLNEYQDRAAEMILQPCPYEFWAEYLTISLAAHTGKIAGVVSQVLSDDDAMLNEVLQDSIKSELGRCLWIISEMARNLGTTLDEIAERSLKREEH